MTDQIVGDNVRYAMWRLLDYNPSPPQGDAGKEQKISNVLLTHYQSMRSSYPLTWRWLNAKKYWLADYLRANHGKQGMPLAKPSDDDIVTAVSAVHSAL